MYINCHSYYSFLYGTMDPEALVARASEAGVKVLALTDINNTSGWYDFMRACERKGVRPVLGVEIRHEERVQCVLLARDKAGVYVINKYLSEFLASKRMEEPPDNPHVYVLYPLGGKELSALGEREYVWVSASQLPRLYRPEYRMHRQKMIAHTCATLGSESDLEVHRVLRAVHHNVLLSKLDAAYTARADEYIVPEVELGRRFGQYPELLERTCGILEDCAVDYDLHAPKNRKTFTGSVADDRVLLEKLALEGCTYRYGVRHKEALTRVRKELGIIHDLGFNAYFLITWDILRYAESRGFHWVGRGSGANSIVAYCLKISNVDPIELDLYFERFINPYRTSPPDFDIDFSWDERDEVIDYIFKRYGKEYVCLLATYNTFKGRSIVRELGKVYGLPKADIDLLVEEPLATHKHHGLAAVVYEMGKHIMEFPDHLSIHAGGVLITEEPLYYYTALDLMPKGFPVCQFDMHVAEDWGFYKYDILSQRGLGHIKESVDIIRSNRGVVVDVHRVRDFMRDDKVRELLRSAHTIGCFYIESPAMRGLLSKLRCDHFVALVAAISIIRPGVAKSGMMREYISRFHHPESVQYIHPVFAEVLQETFGVMVYQEDVIKIAHFFAGLDLGEADILRRGMSGKSRSKAEFRRVEEKFFLNCKEKGYSDALAAEVWRQIESFSGYSFCKAHSASFAVESYQSLYLKTYYPLEFMVAVINNFGGFYSTELYVHEARMCGAEIEAPCVNISGYKTLIRGTTLYLGFVHVRHLEADFARRIVIEREQHGPYLGLSDFVARTGAHREQLNVLIRVGAFRFTGKAKQQLLWEKNDYLVSKAPLRAYGRMLPGMEPVMEEFVSYDVRPFEDVFDQIDLLGFPLCSPFDLIRSKDLGEVVYAAGMASQLGKIVRMVGYYVTRKDTRTTKGDLMNFGTWVDAQGRFFDSVHFPPQLKQHPFSGRGCYLMQGKVVEDFGFCMLEVRRMYKLPMIADPR